MKKQSKFIQSREVALPPMLFDLDGTLVDSAYQRVLAWHETFRDFRMDISNWKIHRRIGMSGAFFLPGLLREIGHSANPGVIDRLEKRHSKYFDRRIKTIPPRFPAQPNSCGISPRLASPGRSPRAASALRPRNS
jgi:hypothetical protein